MQLLVAIGLLVVGSQLFVQALHQAADALHVAPLVLALIVVPLATELPETINGVLWVRSRQDSLAFGNVAGSALRITLAYNIRPAAGTVAMGFSKP